MMYKNRKICAGLRAFTAVLVMITCLSLFACTYPEHDRTDQENGSPQDTVAAEKTDLRPLSRFDRLTVGDHFLFGSYPQNAGEPEPVEWRVLSAGDGKAMAVSEYLLDARRYDSVSSKWKDCELRVWLNEEFYNSAFSMDEKELLVENGGDMVTLLNIGQVQKYFRDDADRVCITTAYARNNGGVSFKENNAGWWWIRTPGFVDAYAAFVDFTGSVYAGGDHVDSGYCCIRPVVWVAVDY